MRRKIKISILVVFLSITVISCATVPITGRRQLEFIPSETVLSLSLQQYDQFLKDHEAVTGTEQAAMVERVGRRIQNAVETYMAENALSDQLKDYAWEFTLIENEAVNAWCLPGGKVVVYTGILPVAQGEDGLAVIIGHEVAHAIARHGNERMSQALLTQLGGVALSYALKEKPERTQQIWAGAFGLGTQFGILMPFSRLHESEADHLGLVFMAMAGYDPHHAVDFWQRMSREKGASVPEFLSTHPSDKTRIAQIKEQIPEVMEYYSGNQ